MRKERWDARQIGEFIQKLREKRPPVRIARLSPEYQAAKAQLHESNTKLEIEEMKEDGGFHALEDDDLAKVASMRVEFKNGLANSGEPKMHLALKEFDRIYCNKENLMKFEQQVKEKTGESSEQQAVKNVISPVDREQEM